MNSKKVVRIAAYQGMNMSWNLNLFSGPKWALRCGQCMSTWTQRIPKMDHPIVGCPHCGTLNSVPVEYT